MKIQPVSSPHAMTAPQNSGPNQDARARAIAKLTAPQAQETPVSNPNQVQPEELSAIQSSQPVDNGTVDESVEETITEETPKAPEKDPALERQFQLLARQERALNAKRQQQEQAIKAREEQLAAREAAIAAKDQEYRSGYISKDRFKQDPLSILAETGVSYEELTQQLISQQPTDPRVQAKIDRLEAQLAEMQKLTETSQKANEEKQQQAYQAALNQIKLDTTKLVEKDPEFELIKATDSIQDVVDLIEETYKLKGYVMPVKEAAEEVEAFLLEETSRLTNLEKIKKRLANASATQKPAEVKPQPAKVQTQPTMKTLTNAASSARKLSAKERAMLAFKGELK